MFLAGSLRFTLIACARSRHTYWPTLHAHLGGEMNVAWHTRALERTLAALEAASSAPDRLALIRTAMRFEGGHFNAPGGLRAEEHELLPRFGLAPSGAGGLRFIDESDPPALMGLATAMRPDLAPRRLYAPAGPDAVLLRHTAHKTYSSAAQKAAVRALTTMPDGGTLLASLPTGMGKSLLFQLAPLVATLPGRRTCVAVITPTIALALDHARALSEFPGLQGSKALTSDCTQVESENILAAFRRGEVPVLLLSPEKALSKKVRADLIAATQPTPEFSNLVGQLTHLFVDEAHIIEAWGRNFRPDFQRLPSLMRDLRLANAGFKASLLSATLPRSACDVLRSQWGGSGPWLEVHAGIPRYEQDTLVAAYTDAVVRDRDLDFVIDRASRPALVYTTTVAAAEELHRRLRVERGYRRLALFTGDTSAEDRKLIVEGWNKDHLDLVIGTSAFGMGIDKSGVRSVIHACLPETAARYYQEIGRASRDGGQGFAACLFTKAGYPNDLDVARRLATNGWLSRELAEERWAELLLKSASIGLEAARSVRRFNLDAVRSGLSNRSSDYNVAWNMMLLLLMQRAGVIDILTGDDPPAEGPAKSWDAVVLDSQLFATKSPVWDRIFELRDAEQRSASRDHASFARLMQAPGATICFMRDVFQLIEPNREAPPCGHCSACRSAFAKAPTIVEPGGLESVWDQPGQSSPAYGRGVFLVDLEDPAFAKPPAPLLRALARHGIQQFLLPEALLAQGAAHLRDEPSSLGLTLAVEAVDPDGAIRAARLSSAIFLSPNQEHVESIVRRIVRWAEANPELTLLVCCDPRRTVGGRRLDQFLSPHAPLAEALILSDHS